MNFDNFDHESPKPMGATAASKVKPKVTNPGKLDTLSFQFAALKTARLRHPVSAGGKNVIIQILYSV